MRALSAKQDQCRVAAMSEWSQMHSHFSVDMGCDGGAPCAGSAGKYKAQGSKTNDTALTGEEHTCSSLTMISYVLHVDLGPFFESATFAPCYETPGVQGHG